MGKISQLLLRDEWYTPDDVFQRISDKYGPFDLDAAASVLNAKCKRFWTVDDNSLEKPWTGRVWCNPPYKDIVKWTGKALAEIDAGRASKVVLLLPAHTSTKWFHDHALARGEVEFIKGRISFGGSTGAPFFSSVIVVFGGGK